MEPSATPAPEPADDLASYRPAMRPGFEDDIAALAGIPRYDLQISVDTAGNELAGVARITYPNRSGEPLSDVALRLYTNFPRDVFGRGGDTATEIGGVDVDGHPASWSYAAQSTAVLVTLPTPLPAEARTTLTITYTIAIQPDTDGAYTLAQMYPLLAVREAGAWRLDVTSFADRVYAESALYHAAIEVPPGLAVIGSGSPVGDSRNEFVTGPVREFAFAVGDFAASRSQQADVAVNVYTVAGSSLDASQIAEVAAGALADFDARFGPYPYRELDIRLLPGQFDGGDEFPGFIVMTSDAQIDAGARYVAAHEVGHQWWYGVVGNDIYHEPWLDEAFAQYSGVLYAEDAVGTDVAAADWQREVLRRYQGALADGDLPVGLAISAYPSFNVYYRTIYGKGPVFLRTLREQIGDAAFFDGLQRYYAEQRYGLGTTAEIRRAFEAASGQDLAALFGTWVGP